MAYSSRKKQVLKKAKKKRQNYAQTERNHLIYILVIVTRKKMGEDWALKR
jgi:hypothetical protein